MLFCSLYDGPLLRSVLNFLFAIMPRFPVTTCPAGYVNFDYSQLQLRFYAPISKSSSLIVYLKLKLDCLFKIETFACYYFGVGVANCWGCLVLNKVRDCFFSLVYYAVFGVF